MPHPDEGTIHAWLDGALSPAEARAFEDHVAGCAECEAAVAGARGLLAASSRILSALDNVPAGVVPTSGGTLEERIARSSRDTNASGRFRATRWRAAAAVVVVAGASWLVLHPRPQSVSDVPASEKQELSAFDSTAITAAPQVAAVVPQSTKPTASSDLRDAAASASTPRRVMVPRPTEAAVSRGDSLASSTVLGYGAGAQGRVVQTLPPSTNAYKLRSAAVPGATVEAVPRARDAAAGNVVTTDALERRAQSLAKADVAAKREEAQAADADRAAIDSVLAADSAQSVPGYGALGARSDDKEMKRREVTSAPSAPAPPPGVGSRLLGESSTIDRAAGCYAIETSGWIPEDQPDHGTPSLLPARIELQRAIGLSGDESGNRLARPAPGEPGLSPGVIGFWKPLGGDRIRVTFADDTSWVALTLVIAPESVRGPARAYSASSGRLRGTEVTARRTLCRTEP